MMFDKNQLVVVSGARGIHSQFNGLLAVVTAVDSNGTRVFFQDEVRLVDGGKGLVMCWLFKTSYLKKVTRKPIKRP